MGKKTRVKTAGMGRKKNLSSWGTKKMPGVENGAPRNLQEGGDMVDRGRPGDLMPRKKKQNIKGLFSGKEEKQYNYVGGRTHSVGRGGLKSRGNTQHWGGWKWMGTLIRRRRFRQKNKRSRSSGGKARGLSGTGAAGGGGKKPGRWLM